MSYSETDQAAWIEQRQRLQQRQSTHWLLPLAGSLGIHGLVLGLLFAKIPAPPAPEVITSYLPFRLVDAAPLLDPPPEPVVRAQNHSQPSGKPQPDVLPLASGGQPSPPLFNQLETAVEKQNWQAALAITEQMLRVEPERQAELMAYRHHLSQLQQPLPTPLPVVKAVKATPLPIVKATPPPTPLFPPAPLEKGSGHGGQTVGFAQTQSQLAGEVKLAAQADVTWGSYLAQLQEEVEKTWLIQNADHAYVTVVRLTLNRSGQLQQLDLTTPSGDPLVDAAVLSSIQRAAPFAPLPANYRGERQTFEIDVLSGSNGSNTVAQLSSPTRPATP
ncbi:MAG: TonB family protein [Cyanobacteriota bacterium]|nr:TonB family protein [Cyanobacteriota bacterium]